MNKGDFKSPHKKIEVKEKIKEFFINKTGSFNCKQISEILGSERSHVNSKLRELEKEGFLVSEKTGCTYFKRK